MSHTPGPWSLSGESVYATRVDGPDGNKVALAQYLLSDGRSIPEAIANARLISAAPDLLEACELAIHKLKSIPSTDLGGHHDRVLMKLEDAVSKARRKA